ncbi:MAG: hypothetical protein M3P30_08080 [Chloroflexota bacterium]|nr:hypothetical protein [Chloroflexota bacterium]
MSSGIPIAWVQLGAILAVLFAAPFRLDVDPDFWWHLRTGDLIVHHGIPRHDVFSWSAQGQAWTVHEWLSEAIIYVVQTTLGYAANAALFGAAAVGALVLMYQLARRGGAGSRLLVGLMLVAVAIFAIFIAVRPQVFTWLLFAVFLFVLQRDYDGDSVPLWPLVPLMGLWANMHLGFVYGLVLIGAWCLARVFDHARGRPADLRKALLIVAACVLAACLNPHGPTILSYPVRYFIEGQADRSLVREWQRPDVRVIAQQPIFLADILLLGALCLRTRPRPFLCIVTIAFITLSLQALRNAPFVGLLLLPVAGSAFAARWPMASRAKDSGTRVGVLLVIAVIAIVLGSVVLVAVQRGAGVSLRDPSERGYPAAGAAWVNAHGPGKRILNEYSWGGYLIEVLNPRAQVFIDGRADFYGNRILNDYATMYRARAGWRELLTRYDPDVVFIPKTAPLAEALRNDSLWHEEFSSDIESVFVKQRLTRFSGTTTLPRTRTDGFRPGSRRRAPA